MTSPASPRATRAPGTDWQDSYFNLDGRYRQLQQRFNAQQEEIKLLKVAQRKAQPKGRGQIAGEAATPGSGPTSNIGPRRRHTVGAYSGLAKQTPGKTKDDQRGSPDERSQREDHVFVGVAPSPSQANDSRARAVHLSSLLGNGTETGEGLPDPAMIWGAEGSVQNYVAANALYHANEELRRKLDESSTLVQTLQKELSSTRTLCTNAQARIEDLAQQMHQLVRERDLASQKLATAKQSIRDFEHTLQDRIGSEEKVRFSLESQIAELRSRLMAGADNNELLTKDVRVLLAEAKDKTAEVMSLRSKLALAEAGLSSQRNTNESLLLELKNLNDQLIDERKRLLTAAREVQRAALVQNRVADLEAQVRRLGSERAAVEADHNRLMGEFVRVTEDALRHAREEVQADLTDWRGAAQHWEEVSQLLYKDVTERTKTHIRCRAECDEAKAQRDMAGVEIRAAKNELAVLRAKLDVVWPSHGKDAEGLSADEVLETFRRRKTLFADVGADKAGGQVEEADAQPTSPAMGTYAEALGSLPVDHASAAELVHELQEANATLLAELEQMRLTNDMLQERVHKVSGRHATEANQLRDATREVEEREQAGRRVLKRQLDRVQFLEAQVRSLRGYQVSPNTAVQDVAPSETVLELFLGQLVAAEVPIGVDVPEAFRHVFCSADFLLHETVTTPTITGLNGFFDTTVSFCISMDALLLYYLQTRQLFVQLHRIRRDDEVEATLAGASHANGEQQKRITDHHVGEALASSSSVTTAVTRASEGSLKAAEQMYETVAEGFADLADIVVLPEHLHAARPTLKGHVKLVTPAGRHIASLEFQLTARTPFTEDFRQLAAESGTTPPGGHHEPRGGSRPGGSPEPGPHELRTGVADWIHRSASSSVRPQRRRASSSRRRTGRGGYGSSPSDMRLVPTSRGGGGTLGTSSLDSSSRPGTPDGRRGGAVEVVRMRLRGGSSPEERWPSALQHGHVATPPSEPGAFAHISRSLLTPVTAGPQARHRHQRETAYSSAPASPQAIHSVAVEVVRVELPADLPTPIPRLTCFFSVPALGREVRLPAPSAPRYTVEYDQPDGALGTVCAVTSLTQLAALAREPLMFFLIDEDAPRGDSAVWAMALCEWSEVLEQPEESLAYSLPLLQQFRSSTGKEERTIVKGGALRVRLVASTESAPPSHSPHITHRPVQAAAVPAPSQYPPRSTQSIAVSVTAPPGGSPSALTALQQLMQQVRERSGEPPHIDSTLHQQQQPQQQQAPSLSMGEEMMQMEYARMAGK